jgi:hypothetical protein
MVKGDVSTFFAFPYYNCICGLVFKYVFFFLMFAQVIWQPYRDRITQSDTCQFRMIYAYVPCINFFNHNTKSGRFVSLLLFAGFKFVVLCGNFLFELELECVLHVGVMIISQDV